MINILRLIYKTDHSLTQLIMSHILISVTSLLYNLASHTIIIISHLKGKGIYNILYKT